MKKCYFCSLPISETVEVSYRDLTIAWNVCAFHAELIEVEMQNLMETRMHEVLQHDND